MKNLLIDADSKQSLTKTLLIRTDFLTTVNGSLSN